MMQKISSMILWLLFMALGLCAQILPSNENNEIDVKLKALLSKNHFRLSGIGIILKNIETDSVIYAMNADTQFNPASVAKLTTAAMAFEKLGVNYIYKTNVYTENSYRADSGICNGNLYIKGSGDPSLVIERMWIFIQYLYHYYGLRTITGDIILDDSFFDTISTGPCFEEDSDASNPYAAPVNALSANFNTVELYQTQGAGSDGPVRFGVFPPLPTIDMIIKGSPSGHNRKPSVPKIFSEKIEDKTRFTISGAMARDGEPYRVIRKVHQTWSHFGGIFKMFLDENKISLKVAIRHGQIPDSVKTNKPLFVWESPPLWQLVNDMMKYSTNFCAEMIFKTLSAAQDSGGGSWEKTAQMAQSWWKEKGLPGYPLIKNGSGMGDCNRYSSGQLSALLSYMWHQKAYLPEWLGGFPIAGVDGTLRSRFKDSRLKGILRGKTGTLNDYGVSAIAGYAFMPKTTYSFVILFNKMTIKYPYQNWEMQQKILEMILP
jgi:serine-type D-Ala-D-Ala carboxypeptidase/endopeptidase (penicillin-binding protein 4)